MDWTQLFKSLPDVVKNAGAGPLSIFALALLVFGFLVWRIAKGASQWFNVLIFLCLFGGVVALGIAISKLESTPGSAPKSTQTTAASLTPMPPPSASATASLGPKTGDWKDVRDIVRACVREPVGVTLTLDKSSYVAGDIPLITVKTAQDCDVALFYSDAAGKVLQLFPNLQLRNNKVHGNRSVQLLPAPNPQNKMVGVEIFGPPFGTERFVAVAARDLWDLTEGEIAQGVFPEAKPKAARIIVVAGRAADKDAASVTQPHESSDTGFAVVTVTTRER